MAFGYRINLEPILTKLGKIKAFTGNLKPALELSGTVALQMIDERFRRQGPGWRDLTERTKLARRNKGPLKILQDDGRLRASIVTPQGSEGGVYELEEKSLVIGSNLVYAAIHQFGWPAGSKHPPPTIPARPYIPNVEDMIPRIHEKLLRYTKDELDVR